MIRRVLHVRRPVAVVSMIDETMCIVWVTCEAICIDEHTGETTCIGDLFGRLVCSILASSHMFIYDMFIYDTASSYMLNYAPSISSSPRAASTSPRMHMQRATCAGVHIVLLDQPTCQSPRPHLSKPPPGLLTCRPIVDRGLIHRLSSTGSFK